MNRYLKKIKQDFREFYSLISVEELVSNYKLVEGIKKVENLISDAQKR